MIFKKKHVEVGPTIEQIASNTIKQLETGNDYRQSVINCYKQMCSWLGSRGINKIACQTPREFAMVAKDFIKISPQSLYNLTQIFEKARYSKHEITLTDRDRAIKYLNEILSAPAYNPQQNQPVSHQYPNMSPQRR